MKVIYEPHPVTRERKAELRAQGFTIVDAIYAPKDAAGTVVAETDGEEPFEEIVQAVAASPKRRGRQAKA